MTMLLTFEIPGSPVPKGRPRVTRRGTFTPQKTKDYEQAVGEAAMVAVKAQSLTLKKMADGTLWYSTKEIFEDPSGQWPVGERYSVECEFYFKKNPACDGDNILKAVQDGLEKVLYANDKQVVAGSYKTYKGSDRDMTYVTVHVLDDWN